MRAIFTTLLVAAGLMLTACASPKYLQEDFGRAYTAAFTTQADLDRPTAIHHDYPLNGVEALAIREQVAKKTSDEAKAIPVLIGTSK